MSLRKIELLVSFSSILLTTFVNTSLTTDDYSSLIAYLAIYSKPALQSKHALERQPSN